MTRITSDFCSEITKSRKEWSEICVGPTEALISVDSTQFILCYK